MALEIWYFFIYMLIVGMSVGWLAWVVLGKSKTLMTGRRPNWGALTGLGVAGSFVGGLAASLLSGEGMAFRPTGLVGSFLGTLIVIAVYVAMKRK